MTAPAFPSPGAVLPGNDGAPYVQGAYEGMSLRDYFAAKALNAYIAGCIAAGHAWSPAEAAKDAYVIADAMLAARGAA